MSLRTFSLPEDFLLGSATASLQIEGGDKNNNWYRWSEMGKIKDGSSSVRACDHWNRVDEDIALMKKLHQNVYRMGIEWSRIMPERGKFDEAAMKHYRDEIVKLRDAGIQPMVTLHHFTNPLWIEDDGGWLSPDTVAIFEEYVEYVVNQIGDLVSDWVTINEPNVYAAYGHVAGGWPPGHKKLKEYFIVARHMIQAHLLAYKKIHHYRKLMGRDDAMVGVAFHMMIFDPAKGGGYEKFAAKFAERYFETLFTEGMIRGKYLFPVGFGYPMDKGIFSDFIGINYYTRIMIGSNIRNLKMGFVEPSIYPLSKRNDLGWEIYAEGLFRVCKKLYDRYKLPVFVTENGTCDNEDKFRARYIYDHLYQIRRLLDDGVDVRRYYHWSTMDNFEWLEGESARFGLIHVDYKKQKRTIKTSGKFYGEICKKKEIDEKMIETYLMK